MKKIKRQSSYPSARLRSLEARLCTAEKKLAVLRKNRPCGKTDRACRTYMDKFFAQQHKVDRLRGEVSKMKLARLAKLVSPLNMCWKPPAGKIAEIVESKIFHSKLELKDGMCEIKHFFPPCMYVYKFFGAEPVSPKPSYRIHYGVNVYRRTERSNSHCAECEFNDGQGGCDRPEDD